MGNLTNSLLLF